MRSRTLLSVGIALALTLVAAASAAAATTYRVSISGSYTTTGTVTNSRCSSGPLTGEASETADFRTQRPAKLFVQRLGSGFPAIALVDEHRPLQAEAVVTRLSSLDRFDTPIGCDTTLKARDCGRQTVRFDVAFGPGTGGVAPDLSKNLFGRPPAFTRCALTTGMSGFPVFAGGSGTARVSAAKLLAGRRLVLRGGRRDGERESVPGIESNGTQDLRYTITLSPVRG